MCLAHYLQGTTWSTVSPSSRVTPSPIMVRVPFYLTADSNTMSIDNAVCIANVSSVSVGVASVSVKDYSAVVGSFLLSVVSVLLVFGVVSKNVSSDLVSCVSFVGVGGFFSVSVGSLRISEVRPKNFGIGSAGFCSVTVGVGIVTVIISVVCVSVGSLGVDVSTVVVDSVGVGVVVSRPVP